MMNEHEKNKLMIILKYKKSITLDTFLVIFPLFAIMASIDSIVEGTFDLSDILFIFSAFVLLVFFLLSDKILKNGSIGKRLYKIKICNKDTFKKLTYKSVLNRRLLELTIHPFFVKNFYSKSQMIDKLTNTYIDSRSKEK